MIFREELNINVEKYRGFKRFVTLADTFQHLCTGSSLLSKAYLEYLKNGLNFSKLSLLRFSGGLVSL